MGRYIKILILILMDFIIVAISLFLAYALKFDNLTEWISKDYDNLPILLIFVGSATLSNALFGCYNNIWQLAGVVEALRQGAAATVTLLMNIFILSLLSLSQSTVVLSAQTKSSVIFIAVLLQFLMMSFIRFMYRISSGSINSFFQLTNRSDNKRVVIYSGIENSKLIIEKINRDKNHNKTAVAVIDEENDMQMGSHISGVKIFSGGIDILEDFIEDWEISEVIVSENQVDKDKLVKIFDICKEKKCVLRIFSGIQDYRQDEGIRNVNIEDLLGRTEAKLDIEEIEKYISGKVIMVTGGAGSIGSEICRQALKFNCAKLIVYDFSENGLFELENELKLLNDSSKFKVVLGSVRDADRLDEIFKKYYPDTVFHAAAHKHVPMMESNAIEAVKNNVFGTINVAKKAIEYNVKKFILISTDKAVNPANIMGATKRIAEMIIQSLNSQKHNTEFAAVRFGNVLNSSGSVIPTFREQIKRGGPVTVTHPDVKRYFMTIPEAVQLVMQAGSMAKGGEIFVLDMGKPIKIYDMALDMIRLSGLEPNKDIQVEIVGLRPGEKMFEEISLSGEIVDKTTNDKIYICKPAEIEISKNFSKKIEDLKKIIEENEDADYQIALKDIVEEYKAVVFVKTKDKPKEDEQQKSIASESAKLLEL